MIYEDGGCPYNESCIFSHGWKEMDYHPAKFKTRKCKEGNKCKNYDYSCPFWHTQSDRRYGF